MADIVTVRDYPLVLEPIIHLLPPAQQPDRPVQISTCVKDGSCRLSSGDLMARSSEMAREGKSKSELSLSIRDKENHLIMGKLS